MLPNEREMMAKAFLLSCLACTVAGEIVGIIELFKVHYGFGAFGLMGAPILPMLFIGMMAGVDDQKK